jgi:hypothetical protein
MLPTSYIARNLSEEIGRGSVGKNWVGRFVNYQQRKLKSPYLRNIDNLWVAADYVLMFILFCNTAHDFTIFSSI